MKIAVASRDENVCELFENTAQFILYETSGNVIRKRETMETAVSDIRALCELFAEKNVEIFLCGSIQRENQDILRLAGIAVFSGVTGRVQKAVEMFLCNDLRFDTGLSCPHHGGDGK